MGEARRRALIREDAFAATAPIGRKRFNLFAIGTRMSVIARDPIGRFRCVAVDASLASQFRAEEALRLEIARLVRDEDVAELGNQGDTPNAPIDLLRVPPARIPPGCTPIFVSCSNGRPDHPAAQSFARLAPG